jgi:hypothetical protein
MSENEKNHGMDATRDKVQNWLMSEGWQIAEPTHPEFAWLIRAEDGGERRILVGQNKAREDRIHLEANVKISDDHRKLLPAFSSPADEGGFRGRGRTASGCHPDPENIFRWPVQRCICSEIYNRSQCGYRRDLVNHQRPAGCQTAG